MRFTIGLIFGAILLGICWFSSVAFGVAEVSLAEVWAALVSPNDSTQHLIIQSVRLPRSLIALFVGAAMAVAGAIMQGLTRNPLASPGILGVNAGASLVVVAAIFWLGSLSASSMAGFAILGATLAAIAVYWLGSLGQGGLTPLNLTIAGAAFTAFVSSITTGILILSQRTLDEIRFWLVGSVAGRDLSLFLQVLPFLGVGLLLAFSLSRQITLMSLGEDVAKGLGQQTVWVKLWAAVSVVLLAGGSVAIAGPISFIGLVTPHLVRFWVGVDYRWILPYAAILGATLLLVADILARLLIAPQELPVGVITPLIGAPFFVYLARWKVKR